MYSMLLKSLFPELSLYSDILERIYESAAPAVIKNLYPESIKHRQRFLKSSFSVMCTPIFNIFPVSMPSEPNIPLTSAPVKWTQ